MADILIRGMEMPDGCHNCGFSYFDKWETNGGELCTVLMCSIINQGTNGAEYDGNRPFWCPLAPLPEKHGRLIDADALRKEFPEPEDWKDFAQAVQHITGIWATIDNAPTIVPAEGGGE